MTITNLSGATISLRPHQFEETIDIQPPVKFFEVMTEQNMRGGWRLDYLEKIRQEYAIALHGVCMSLGSVDNIDREYLKNLKTLAERLEVSQISDHLSWSSVNGQHFHDLLPLPYTEEALINVSEKIKQAQDYLEQPILIENISSYMTYSMSEMTEPEFLCNVLEKADCYLLLDVNNLYVNACNHCFDPLEYLAQIPVDRVRQFHLAGYTDHKAILLDTHSEPIHQPVWDLYKYALKRFGSLPTIIEWDNNLPSLQTLLDEATKANHLLEK